MLKKMLNQSSNTVRSVELTDKINNAYRIVTDSVSSSVQASSTLFEKHLPAIEGVVSQALRDLTQDKLKDDALLEIAFARAYELLPLPIRLVIPRDKFFAFCKSKKSTFTNSVTKNLIKPSSLGSSRSQIYKR